MPDPSHDKIIEILEAHKHMTLALVRPDGFPQAVTVSYANKGTTLYFGTDADANKGQHLKRNQNVSVAISKDYDNWNDVRALCISGKAERVDDLTEFEVARRLILDKFTNLPHYDPDTPETAVFFRIIPLTISVLDYTQGIGHSEYYEF